MDYLVSHYLLRRRETSRIICDTENGLTHWKANENEPERPSGSWWWYRVNSADVETTAYALMATLATARSEDQQVELGLPIVRWLSTQRNAYGGFRSTQVRMVFLSCN